MAYNAFYFSYSRSFRIMDDDGNKSISREEFKKGLTDYHCGLSDEEYEAVFQLCDKDSSGALSFDEFLIHLKPPMNQGRIDIVEKAFAKADKTGDGVITVADMKGVYNVKQNPKYANGEWTEKQCFEEFLKTFEEENNPDGKSTNTPSRLLKQTWPPRLASHCSRPLHLDWGLPGTVYDKPG
nr:calcyphosin-like protein [Lytechinus pictus]